MGGAHDDNRSAVVVLPGDDFELTTILITLSSRLPLCAAWCAPMLLIPTRSYPKPWASFGAALRVEKRFLTLGRMTEMHLVSG
jgi:hypothetical protein